MRIQSSRFPGKPVFHTVDPAWGSDNGVTFTFIPENEAETRCALLVWSLISGICVEKRCCTLSW
jgi:hypothetical protein